MTNTAQGFIVVDFFSRAVGMMLIGVGLSLAAIGLAWVAASDFSPGVAFIGTIPNTLGTVPVVMGYASLIILWNRRSESSLHRRLCSVGRMALTNYLTQTVVGVAILRGILADMTLTRTMLAGFVVVIWVLQLWWSRAWLDRFRFGPAEWLWRVATYLRSQPLRRSDSLSVG